MAIIVRGYTRLYRQFFVFFYIILTIMAGLPLGVSAQGGQPTITLFVHQGAAIGGFGNNTQSFQIQSGETIFVQSNQPIAPYQIPASELNDQEDAAYTAKSGKISDLISHKIDQIQKTQRAMQTEIYPVYQRQTENDLQLLRENIASRNAGQLRDMELERNKIDSQKTAKDAIQKLNTYPVPPQPVRVSGIHIKATLNDNNQVDLQVQSGSTQAVMSIPLNTWTQVINQKGNQLWVKAVPAGNL